MNVIVLLLAVALLLCFVFVWDAQTHDLMNRVIVETYAATNAPRTDGYLSSRHKNRRALSDVVVEDVEFDTPRRIKQTRKMYRFEPSHSGKGATLHTYRVKGFSKKILHPCV